jgi:hypothetical protein
MPEVEVGAATVMQAALAAATAALAATPAAMAAEMVEEGASTSPIPDQLTLCRLR